MFSRSEKNIEKKESSSECSEARKFNKAYFDCVEEVQDEVERWNTRYHEATDPRQASAIMNINVYNQCNFFKKQYQQLIKKCIEDNPVNAKKESLTAESLKK